MKTKCLIPIRYIVAASLMLIGVILTCYDAGANLRRGSVEQNRASEPEIFRSELDEDPEYREQRREFLDRFLGNRPGSVSAAAYKRALAEARALPPSPLLGGQTFRSAETPGAMAPWIAPIAPPIMNSYSANASAAVYSLAIDPITRMSFTQAAPLGLPRQPTEAVRGGICLIGGSHRVSARSLSILPRRTRSMLAPAEKALAMPLIRSAFTVRSMEG